jgi:hypothetical protein
METSMADPGMYGDAWKCIRAAQESMRQIKKLLARPSAETVDQSAGILREIEVQLGCAAAILKKEGAEPDPSFRSAIEDLQDEVSVLARFFSDADKFFSGWLRIVRARRGGYTERGQAAPLVLVNRLTVEG